MRHAKKGRKFARKRDQRKALLKIMAANLIMKEKIVTTQAKAKELRPYVEKLITKARLAKKNPLRAVSLSRQLAAYLPEKARKKIINELGPQYQDRKGGYTRIIKLPPRPKDNALMAVIELVKE